MIYTLKELLQKDTKISIITYINDQLSELLGDTLTKNKMYEMSCTTHFFLDVNEKLDILGIIVISYKTFLFHENMFFIELLVSKNKNKIVEQSLLLKCINHISNLCSNNKIISFIGDERIETEVLTPFGFVRSQGVMVKI